jgi:trimethylamine--corrinoid protein Co-methyltransferase
MTCAAIGGEVVNGLGVPDGSTLLTYEQFLLDHEIAGMVLKVFKGYPVSKDTLATDLVKKVGIGGSYLAQMHTIKNMREIFIPALWDSDPFDMWVKKGAKDPIERALEKVDEILKTHKPVPLDKRVSERLGTIVKQFK